MSISFEGCFFYGILDTGYVSADMWKFKCQSLIKGGADIIQLRAKKESLSERIALLEEVLPLFEEKDSPCLIINDDIELALKYPGLGLHVGQDDTAVLEARERLGPDRILGLSTHSLAQATQAIAFSSVLNYFAVGPVFQTATKPTYEPVGLELISRVCALKPPIPFFAIGGVSRATVTQVRQAGAKRIVVVSDTLLAKDTAQAVAEIRSRIC